jgi:hypothetical protein
MLELADVATRVDRDGGYREEVSFAAVRGVRVFSVLHRPLRETHAGLVICPPILMEHLTNYRHEVLLARELAGRGIAVQRFHYRGTGHSEGEGSEVSVATMLEDTLPAVERLREQTGVAIVAFHGTRWGARVVGSAAASFPLAPVSFWEPVVDAGRYFREMIRGRLVREMKDQRFVESGADSWAAEMQRDGRVDILGYPLYQRLYEDGRGPALHELLASTGPRPALVVQMGQRMTVRPDLARLKQAIEMAGGECDVRIIRDEPAWMFAGHRMKSADKLVKVTADWLVSHVRESARG